MVCVVCVAEQLAIHIHGQLSKPMKPFTFTFRVQAFHPFGNPSEEEEDILTWGYSGIPVIHTFVSCRTTTRVYSVGPRVEMQVGYSITALYCSSTYSKCDPSHPSRQNHAVYTVHTGYRMLEGGTLENGSRFGPSMCLHTKCKYCTENIVLGSARFIVSAFDGCMPPNPIPNPIRYSWYRTNKV